MEFVSDADTEKQDYLTLDLGQFQIMGRSIAGVETVLAIPQWNLCFDTGRTPSFAFPRGVLALSHWHLDHAGGLPAYLGLRHLNSLDELTILMPPEKLEEAKEFLELLRQISESELRYNLGDAVQAVPLKSGLSIESLPSFHCTPSQGYLVRKSHKWLKDQYVGKSSEEIVAAKQAGESVDTIVQEPMLAFSGDSKAEFLGTEARKAQILIMECSFFGDTSTLEKVHEFGHAHIVDWVPYLEGIESEKIIMIHTSQRFSKSEIEASCREHLSASILDRLVVFR